MAANADPSERREPCQLCRARSSTDGLSSPAGDTEKGHASPFAQRSNCNHIRTRLLGLCAEKAGWAMVGILILLILGLTATLCAIFLTGGGAWTRYKAWEKEHAYDSPIHTAMLSNFPDPEILYYEKRFYAFATNNASGILFRPRNASLSGYGMANIQLAVAKDPFKPWMLQPPVQQPLAHVGAWANPGMTKGRVDAPSIPKAQGWAPGIVQRESDKKFVLYYAAATTPEELHIRPGHCIGAAVSESRSPLGPYEPIEEPLVCDLERGGAIDPSPFQDESGDLYLAYKVDGNNVGRGGACRNIVKPQISTPIMLQKMHDNGTSLDGPAVQILDRREEDGPLVEAPNIVRSKEGIYFLFFSSGCTRDPSYNIKYATSERVTGPYIRAPEPLLSTGDWGLEAPGSPSVIRNPDDEGYLLAFHSRKQTGQGGVRAMSWSKLYLEGRHANLVNDVELGRLKLRPH